MLFINDLMCIGYVKHVITPHIITQIDTDDYLLWDCISDFKEISSNTTKHIVREELSNVNNYNSESDDDVGKDQENGDKTDNVKMMMVLIKKNPIYLLL
jgi:hypothetical protein